VEVQHAAPIGFDNSKMIRKFAKNARLFRGGSKKAFQDRFKDVVKKIRRLQLDWTLRQRV
jgi:hypothetical protein